VIIACNKDFVNEMFIDISHPSFIHDFGFGQVGEWKDHLTVAQSELVDANVKRVLGDTDIEFIYEL